MVGGYQPDELLRPDGLQEPRRGADVPHRAHDAGGVRPGARGTGRPRCGCVAADFKGWTELLANGLAGGDSAARLRSYLKKLAVETWEYVNWLTHAKNAMRMDAEIGLKQVEYLLGMFTAATLRLAQSPTRCKACESYEVVVGVCHQCGWEDLTYEPPEIQGWSEKERTRRLAEPCTPSSDISTLITPHDLMRAETD